MFGRYGHTYPGITEIIRLMGTNAASDSVSPTLAAQAAGEVLDIAGDIVTTLQVIAGAAQVIASKMLHDGAA